MQTIERLFKNTTFLLLSTIFQKMTGFVVTVVLARYLGTEGFGRYSFMLVFVLLADTVMCNGIDVLMVREIAKCKSQCKSILENVLSFKMLLVPIYLAAAFLALFFMDLTAKMQNLILIFVFFQVFYSIHKTLSSFFSAHERLGYVALLDIVFSALKTFLLLGVVFLDLKFASVIFGICVSYFAVFMAAVFIYYRNFDALSFRLEWRWIKKNMSNSIWFILFVITYGYFWKIDQLIITKALDYEKIGVYSAAFLLIDLSIALSLTYFSSVFPLISRICHKDNADYESLREKSYKYFMIISIPVPFMGVFVLDELIRLVYGPSFAETALIGKILLFAIPFILMQSFALRIAFSSGREKPAFFATALAIIIKVLLNSIFLGIFGVISAAFTVILVEILYIYLTVIFCLERKDFDLRKIAGYAVKPFLATCVMTAGLYFLRNASVFWSITSGLAFYLSGLVLFKAIDEEEMNLISKTFRYLLVQSK